MASKQEPSQPRRRPPGKTVEARQNQLVSLGWDLAERQIRDGSIKATVLAQVLKLGTVQAERELMLLEQEIELKAAKAEAIRSEKRIEELYEEAIAAMREYSGYGDEYFDED